MIGALAVPWTQGTGITFLTTSFGVAAWHLGIALVDILLASISIQIFGAAGFAGGVTAATVISIGVLPIFLGALVAIVCVALALYLAVPIVIAAVLRGNSPLTTAATSGMQMTLTALGLASMAGSRIAATSAASGSKAGESKPSSEGDSGGDEKTGMAPRPSTSPPVGGLSATTKRRGSSTETEETAAEDGSGSPAERQTQILASYEDASRSRKTRLSSTKPTRPVTEITRVLDHAG